MTKDPKQVLKQLKELNERWLQYMKFHFYLHEGEEHNHSLEEMAIELERSIILTYRLVDDVEGYTEQDMLKAVEEFRSKPPRQYLDSCLADWDLIPHHPVRRSLELSIARVEGQLGKSDSSSVDAKKQKTEKRFQIWQNPGDASFVIDGDRIMFYHGEKLRDLRIKNHSRAHKMLMVLTTGEVPATAVKTYVCSDGTKPSEAVRDIDRQLNDKIAKVGFTQVPLDTQFITHVRERNAYTCDLPIVPREEI